MVNKQEKFCTQKKVDLQVCDTCVDDGSLNRYRQARVRVGLNNAKRLLFPSKYFAEFYVQNGFSEENIVVNKNGILKPAIKHRNKREGALVFGYVGGNTELKGVGLVKNVFSELNNLDIKLVVVDNTTNLGFPSYENNSFKDIDDVDIVPGYTQDTIEGFYSSIDVLLFPTQCKESFGLTVREALARNVWVISTDAGGVTEDLVHGKNGFIIPFDDRGDEFKQAIQDTIQYYQQIKVGSKISFKTKKITWFEDQANELADIYKQIMQEQ